MRIVVRGLDKAQARFARMGTTIQAEMLAATMEAVLYVQSQIPGYPPPRHAVTESALKVVRFVTKTGEIVRFKARRKEYKRTGILGASINSMAGEAPGALSRVEPLGSGVKGVVGTSIKYGPYVISNKRQARIHQGRWWTLQDVFVKAQSGIADIYRKMVARWKG